MRIPNIILITIDCLRSDALSFGDILSLIPKGLRSNVLYFSNCIAAGPYTWASIPSIFLSQSPSVHNYGKSAHYFSFLDILRDFGYMLVAINASRGFRYFMKDLYRKFDIVVDTFPYRIPHKHYRFLHRTLSNNIEIPHWPSLILQTVMNENSGNLHLLAEYVRGTAFKMLYALRFKESPSEKGTRVLSYAIDIIRNKITEPFFIWIHLMDLHEPYPRDIVEQFGILKYVNLFFKLFILTSCNYRNCKSCEFINIQSLERVAKQQIIELYCKAVTYLYSILKWFLQLLFETQFIENTYLILTADHGEELLEHHTYGHMGILTPNGFTTHLYQELLKVPLLIVGPDTQRAFIDYPVSHLDLAPTILNLVTQSLNTRRYRSILRLFQGFPLISSYRSEYIVNNDDIMDRLFIVSESEAIVRSVNKGIGRAYSMIYVPANENKVYKYILHPVTGEQLFDLHSDPEERTNILNNNNDLIIHLRKKLYMHINQSARHRIKLKIAQLKLSKHNS